MKITGNGLELDSWDDILIERVQSLKDIYGQDIDLRQNTPDGQRVGVDARMISDAQQVAAFIYNEMDPDLASLIGLRRLGKLSGIYQEPVTASQWDVNITADRPVTIRDDFAIQDDLGQRWLADGRSLPVGTTAVTFRSELLGSIGGGTTLERDTVVLGITQLDPIGSPLLGKDEETAEEFRVRRRRTIAVTGKSIMGAMYAGIASISGVTDLQTYDNELKTVDPITGLPGNSVYAVVEGGSITDIVRMMAIHKGMGTESIGEIEDTWTETKIKPNGEPHYIVHKMRFDRPEYVDLHLKMKVTRFTSTEPVDLSLIKQQLASVPLYIGDSLQAGELYENTYIDTARYVVTELEISKDNVVFTDGELKSEINEKFVITVDNITIDEVIP